MLKKKITVGILFALIALSPIRAAFATCATYPYTFTNGTTADATQVMSNLNYISGCAAPTASPLFTGNVGIGTASPAEPLDVFAATSAVARFNSTGPNSALVRVNNQAGGYQSVFEFDDAGATKYQFGKNFDNSFFFFDRTNNKNFITVTTAGNVTFGEAGQMFLPVGGSVEIGPYNGSGSTLNVNNSVSIGAAYVGSAAGTNNLIVQGAVGIGTISPTAGVLTVQNASSHAGQATCWTTGGAIGYCTSAVSGSGSCTCTGL